VFKSFFTKNKIFKISYFYIVLKKIFFLFFFKNLTRFFV